MATLAQIRAGLAARIQTISADLHVYPTPPGNIVAPAVVIRRRQLQYDITLDGAENYSFVVTLWVAPTEDHTAQALLDSYVDPAGANSVVAAIHADDTLGGVVDFARVVSAEEDGLTDYAGVQYLATAFIVDVGE